MPFGKVLKEFCTSYGADIVLEVLGPPKLKHSGGTKWRYLCPFHDERNPSFDVDLDIGFYYCWACGARGNLVDLYAKMRGITWKEAWEKVRKKYEGVIETGGPRPKRDKPKGDKRTLAQKLWEQASKNTLRISTYLKNRGLSGKVPPALRETELYWKLNGKAEGPFPVMLARVDNVDGEIIAVHRTYISPDGSGKAPVEIPKLTLGPSGGGSVHLGLPKDGVLALTEGIETGLAVQEATGLPVWAALSTSGLKSVKLPATIKTVHIFADRDPVDPKTGRRPGEDAAHKLAERLIHEGRTVYVHVPGNPGDKLDWLDVLVSDGPEALKQALQEDKPYESKSEKQNLLQVQLAQLPGGGKDLVILNDEKGIVRIIEKVGKEPAWDILCPRRIVSVEMVRNVVVPEEEFLEVRINGRSGGNVITGTPREIARQIGVETSKDREIVAKALRLYSELHCRETKLKAPARGLYLHQGRISYFPDQKNPDPEPSIDLEQARANFVKLATVIEKYRDPVKAWQITYAFVSLVFSILRKQLGRENVAPVLLGTPQTGKSSLARVLCRLFHPGEIPPYSGNQADTERRYTAMMKPHALPIAVDEARPVFENERLVNILKLQHGQSFEVRSYHQRDGSRHTDLGLPGILYVLNYLPATLESAVLRRLIVFVFEETEVVTARMKANSKIFVEIKDLTALGNLLLALGMKHEENVRALIEAETEPEAIIDTGFHLLLWSVQELGLDYALPDPEETGYRTGTFEGRTFNELDEARLKFEQEIRKIVQEAIKSFPDLKSGSATQTEVFRAFRRFTPVWIRVTDEHVHITKECIHALKLKVNGLRDFASSIGFEYPMVTRIEGRSTKVASLARHDFYDRYFAPVFDGEPLGEIAPETMKSSSLPF